MNDEHRKELVETAVEIVFAYPEWSCEHVNAYMKASSGGAYGGPIYDISELFDMCQDVDEQVSMGNDYDTAIKNLLS